MEKFTNIHALLHSNIFWTVWSAATQWELLNLIQMVIGLNIHRYFSFTSYFPQMSWAIDHERTSECLRNERQSLLICWHCEPSLNSRPNLTKFCGFITLALRTRTRQRWMYKTDTKWCLWTQHFAVYLLCWRRQQFLLKHSFNLIRFCMYLIHGWK